MNPVNLIPPEQRRGERAPLRAGFASYAIVAALAIALGAVTYLVLTQNKISEREAEVASLEARKAGRRSLRGPAPYAEFARSPATRDATVNSLAKSRFDWERVLNELALVIPADVWLVRVAGSAPPTPRLARARPWPAARRSRAPALELIGCGASTDAVARFLAALKDIDGVTRVGIDRLGAPGADRDDGSSSVRPATRATVPHQGLHLAL